MRTELATEEDSEEELAAAAAAALECGGRWGSCFVESRRGAEEEGVDLSALLVLRPLFPAAADALREAIVMDGFRGRRVSELWIQSASGTDRSTEAEDLPALTEVVEEADVVC